MSRGVLAPIDLGVAGEEKPRKRHFVPPVVQAGCEPTGPGAARTLILPAGSLWRSVQTFLLAGAAIFVVIPAVDFAVAKHQELRVPTAGPGPEFDDARLRQSGCGGARR